MSVAKVRRLVGIRDYTHTLNIPLTASPSTPQLRNSFMRFQNDASLTIHPAAICNPEFYHLWVARLKLPTSRQVDAFCAKLHTFDTRNALEAAATTLRPLSSLESNASSSASITEERDLMAEVLPLRIKLLGLSTIEGIVEGGDPASTGILVAKPIDTTNRLPHFLRSLRDFVAGTGFMVSPGDEDSTHQYLGDNITIVNSTMVRWYSKASRKEPKGRAKIPRFDATDLTNKYQAYVWGADIPLDRICLEELGSMAKRSDGAPVQKERPVVATFELP